VAVTYDCWLSTTRRVLSERAEVELMLPSTLKTEPERSGDPLWGLVVGLYVALLVAPLTVFTVDRLVTDDAAALYGTVVVTLAVVVGLAWLATARFDGIATRLGGARLRWTLGILPVGYALLGFASLGRTGISGVLAFFFGAGAMAAGLVLGVMARTRHTDAVLDGVDIDSEFRAGWPSAAKRRLGAVAAAATALAFVCFLAGVFTDWLLLQFAGQLLVPVGLVSYNSAEPRTLTVSAAGLEQRLPVARRLVSWDAFESHTRTDDALVLHRRWRVDTRLALADLDDPDAVEAAISRHLPAA